MLRKASFLCWVSSSCNILLIVLDSLFDHQAADEFVLLTYSSLGSLGGLPSCSLLLGTDESVCLSRSRSPGSSCIIPKSFDSTLLCKRRRCPLIPGDRLLLSRDPLDASSILLNLAKLPGL